MPELHRHESCGMHSFCQAVSKFHSSSVLLGLTDIDPYVPLCSITAVAEPPDLKAAMSDVCLGGLEGGR